MQAIDAKQFLAGRVLPAWIVFGHFAIGHEPDQLRGGHVGDVARRHVAAVAQHRHAMADAEHLVHPVRDVDDRHAARCQARDRGEQLADFPLAQGRCRLVHHQQPGIVRQRPRHFHHLLLRQPEAVHRRVAIDRHAQAIENTACISPHPPEVDDTGPARRRLAEKDVLGDGEVRHEAQLLIDGADPEPSRSQRAAELDRSAVEEDLAGVGSHRAAEDLHQRRLAGAVFAKDDVHFAGAHVQAGVVQGARAGIALRDPAHLQDRLQIPMVAGAGHGGVESVSGLSGGIMRTPCPPPDASRWGRRSSNS